MLIDDRPKYLIILRAEHPSSKESTSFSIFFSLMKLKQLRQNSIQTKIEQLTILKSDARLFLRENYLFQFRFVKSKINKFVTKKNLVDGKFASNTFFGRMPHVNFVTVFNDEIHINFTKYFMESMHKRLFYVIVLKLIK